MTLALVRVDDRLVHGQVIEGWLPVIQAERLVVASDAASADPWQADFIRLAIPDGVRLDVVPVAAAAALLRDAAREKPRVLVLTAGVGDLRRLVEAGAPVDTVNLGGVHDGPGRTSVAPHLFLTEGDKDDLRALEARGVRIESRALPTDASVDWKDLDAGRVAGR
ncbi:MAG: PTS sugar transporter subunit IIB [Elusimicrobia bacterium]|nr:PTS sugar transporter subunit IIB [Elusimicrobiota bacterium]